MDSQMLPDVDPNEDIQAVNKNGSGLSSLRKFRPRYWPRARALRKINYIMGETLDRYCVLRTSGKTIKCIVRRLSFNDRIMQCDGCERRHSPINVKCSRNLHQRTWANRPGHLYDFRTRQTISAKKIDEEWGPYALGYETWELMKQPATPAAPAQKPPKPEKRR